MPQSKETRVAIERLVAINAQLRQTLFEAEIVRARLLKAREANTWPTVPFFRPLKANTATDPS
jgi:hypothetical protein